MSPLRHGKPPRSALKTQRNSGTESRSELGVMHSYFNKLPHRSSRHLSDSGERGNGMFFLTILGAD